MYRLKLYEHESPDRKVSLEVHYNEKNQLVLDGSDIGKTVYELKGNSDYEYHYTIKFDEVKKIADALGTSLDDKNTSLGIIENHFHGNNAFSKFGEFMRLNGVYFEKFFW